MYSYKNSFVQRSILTSQLESLDLEFSPVALIYLNFYKTYLVLSHPASQEDLYVNMDDVKKKLSGFMGTVSDWLLLNGDEALPTIPKDQLPNPKKRSVKYAELSRAGYSLTPSSAGIFYPKEANDKDNNIDLAVERSDFNMNEINEQSLFTINGYIHNSLSLENIAYIKDGMKSANIAGSYTSGLISFAQMGTLERIKLQPENITPFENDGTLKEKISFIVPEYKEGKAFLFVMGGYLILPKEGRFYQVDKGKFVLDISNMNFVEKILESSNFIDLRSLELTRPANMKQEAFIMDELYSDEVLKRYLTLSQSFFVMFSFDNIQLGSEVLMHEPYPGRFVSVREPVEPLMGGYGRLMEYWPRKGRNSWMVETNDNYRRDYIYAEHGWEEWKVVDHAEDVTRPKRLTAGYLLDIFTIQN